MKKVSSVPRALFKRVFSSDFRRGLAAEAAGDYLEAARAYALAGERTRVAEMHVLAAERLPSPAARLAELRTAIRWSEGDDPAARMVRLRVGRALLQHVRAGQVIAEADRSLLREAADLLGSVGDDAGAAECHELAGDEQSAAEAYQRAGEVERLEAVLGREETRRHAEVRRRLLLEESEMHLASGERDLALAALRQCAELDPSGPARALADGVEARRIVDGSVALRIPPDPIDVIHVGTFPFALGREATCAVRLRDPDVSRRHTEVLERDGRFFVRDCRSRNGTTLGGLPVDGELPLDGEGELGLGQGCAFTFRAGGGVLQLAGSRGLDRGVTVTASRAAFPIAGGAAELRFVEGRPFLVPGPDRALLLDGKSAGARVQLLHGDAVEVVGRGVAAVRVEAV